ncbi:Phox homologous domain-containing protein [Xylaria palmicola]|nr:Phox homologous domain-containing protein [Xylaria palmicola]
MDSATDCQYSDTPKGRCIDSDPARDKDSLMPKPQPPPSPPVTETDTDPESPSLPSPSPTSLEQYSSKTSAHAEPPAEGSHLPGSPQDTNRTTLHLDATMEGSSGEGVSADIDSGAEPATLSPVTSPPYWMARTSHDHPSGHGRNVSSASVDSLIPAGLGITLRDNENSSMDDRGNACWAKSVQVTDYVTVNGSATNIGAFVVWNIRVETLNGSFMNIRKRYSEFDGFRWRLMRTFPGFEAAVPELPPKSLISKFRPKFLEKRRAGLQYFLNCIMLNPEFSGSPVLKEFLFS